MDVCKQIVSVSKLDELPFIAFQISLQVQNLEEVHNKFVDYSCNYYPSMSKSIKLSEIQLYGENSSKCGYCERGDLETSVSFGIVCESMSVNEYETMMHYGWRRSGTYFYKPNMRSTCCPTYTIRLNVTKFTPSKSQKKVLKTMNNFLHYDESSSESRHLTVELEASSFTEEKFNLYKKYQTTVHEDPPEKITPKGFTRFLVSSPLYDRRTTAEVASSGGVPYGSFHHCYRLNGVLIAVAVLDLIPSGVSSVYFFYDPSYKHLVLGKYSALKEIEYCQTHQKISSQFTYYYMGYYIHSCEKMRYKGEYRPSELLCPVTMTWRPLDQCIPLLDCFAFTPLDPRLTEVRAAKGVNQYDLVVRCVVQKEKAKKQSGGTSSSASNDKAETAVVDEQGEDDKASSAVVDEDLRELLSVPLAESAYQVDLSSFGPRINRTSGGSGGVVCSVDDVKLDIGAGRPVLVRELRPDSVQELRKILETWVSLTGSLNETMIIKLC